MAVSDKEKSVALPPCLTGAAAGLAALRARGQAPQALLLHGPEGSGRRDLALVHAAALLGAPPERFVALAHTPPPAPEGEGDAPAGERELVHPDFMLVRPPADKHTIPIAAVRTLIDFLHLRSHAGGARVVVLWPAEAMAMQAANALLKTLEEPPAGSSIILVARAVAALPPTVLSRCQRLRVPLPSRDVALAWLTAEAGEAPWEELLDLTGGAPLAALALWRTGAAEELRELRGTLDDLRRRRATPVTVARRWAAADPELALRWLYLDAARDLAAALGVANGPDAVPKAPLQNPAKPLNMRARLERLREVEQFYRDRGRAMNAEAQFASLLLRWYGDAPAGDRS